MLTVVAAAAVIICLAGSSLPLVAGVGLVGDFCTLNNSLPCNVANTYCQKNAACQQGVCQCNAGYASFNSTLCIKVGLRLGVDPCVNVQQCGQYASCTSGLCQCNVNYRALSDGINCDQGIQVLGGNCTVNSQCGSRAICDTTLLTCTCSNSQFKPLPTNYGCRALTYGEACTGSACDTNDGLTCNATCQCTAGHFWANVTLAPNPPDFKCVPTGSVVNQAYGQNCADFSCTSETVMMSCLPSFVCKQCPETTTACSARKCLYDSILANPPVTTAPPVNVNVTTAAPSAATCALGSLFMLAVASLVSVGY